MRSVRSPDAEGRLLFALASDPEDPYAVPGPGPDTDWSALVQLAARENAAIALRDHCVRLGPGSVSATWALRLALLSLDIERRMREARRRLEELLVGLNRAGIEPIVLKGAALAETVYGSWTERPMSDIDLLLDPAELDRARAIAMRFGWRSDDSVPSEAGYATHHHLPPLLDEAGSGLRLELHRSVLPKGHPFAVTSEQIAELSRRIAVGAGWARVMEPHQHLVHVAIHFVWSHEVRSGAWRAFRDLAALLRSGSIDSDRLERTAREWRATSCLYWLLHLAQSLAGVRVDEEMLRRLRPRWSSLLLSGLVRHFTATLVHVDELCPSIRLNRYLWTAAIRPRKHGHGSARPWLASPELRAERLLMRAPAPGRRPHVLINAGRTMFYLASLVR
jgi:hypothetical protein